MAIKFGCVAGNGHSIFHCSECGEAFVAYIGYEHTPKKLIRVEKDHKTDCSARTENAHGDS
jgi:hypothetical protein